MPPPLPDPSTFDHSVFPAPPLEPQDLKDVVDFWFPLPPNASCEGVDRQKSHEYLDDVFYVESHILGWMMGGEVMDEKCRQFRSLVRLLAGSNKEAAGSSSSSEVAIQNADGTRNERATLIAKIILFDQITRNAFRCEEEAYSYDYLVLDILHELFSVEKEDRTNVNHPLAQEKLNDFTNAADVTFAECLFVSIACQHKEEPMFHDVCVRMNDLMEVRWPAMKDFLKIARMQAQSHLDVLKQFGRYPHRNDIKGREHTEEERKWLDDYDNLPGWAKSQLPKPSSSSSSS